MAVIGLIVTFVGLAMVTIEWRGRFAPEKADAALAKGPAADAATLIDSLGKLKGSTLVLIAGMVILVAAAWMTSSAAGAAPADQTSTPTSTATTTATATP